MLSHRAFDVRVFLRGTQVFLPLPLPHGFQVIGVKGGDPPACWHLLYPGNPPEVQRGQKQCSCSDCSLVSLMSIIMIIHSLFSQNAIKQPAVQ